VCWMGIYIAEAHTLDEWPMPCVNSPCRHVQPKDIGQRLKHAQEFVKQFHPPFDVLLDTYNDGWNDPFLKTFSAWPERFYIFQRKVAANGGNWSVSWANTPDPLEGHRVDDIGEQLRRIVSSKGEPPAPLPLVRTTSQELHAEAQLARIKEVFASYDEEGNGILNRTQTRAVLKSVGYIPEMFSHVFREIDLDASGAIDLKEFEAFFNSIHPRLQDELESSAQLLHVGGPIEPVPCTVSSAPVTAAA